MISPSPAYALKLTGSSLLAMVSKEDLEECWKHDWRAKVDKKTGKVYARAGFRKGGKRFTLYLHRFIMGCSPGDGVIVDHINGDPLDCTRENLRKATYSQNNMNRRSGGRVCYKGVWRTKSGLYRAEIWKDRIRVNLGYHKTPEAAARAYDNEARKLYGEFATLNFPGLGLREKEPEVYTLDPDKSGEDEEEKE